MNVPGCLVAAIIALTLGGWSGLRTWVRFVEGLSTSFCCCVFPFQFKDGETALETVHVGGRPSGTVLGLQVRVFCGFLVQKESLDGENAGFELTRLIQMSNNRHLNRWCRLPETLAAKPLWVKARLLCPPLGGLLGSPHHDLSASLCKKH